MMEEISETAGKVRIVRCPMCENLLPEVTNFSIYQCGGCGAVLTAKNKAVDLDTFSEKPDENSVAGSLDKLSDRYRKMNVAADKRITDFSDGDAWSIISSSSRAERRSVTRGRGENYSPVSNFLNKGGNSIPGTCEIQEKELQQKRISQDFEDSRIWNDNLYKSKAEVMYVKEGPSNLLPTAVRGYGKPVINRIDVESIGDDRAALLKQLDEIKDKLNRSGNLIEEAKRKEGMNWPIEYQDPYAPVSPCPDLSIRYTYEDERVKRLYNNDQDMEPPPLIHTEEISRDIFYHPRYALCHGRVYEDSSRSHMLNGGRQPPVHVYNSRRYMDDGLFYTDIMEQCPPKYVRHHPSCSCYQCCNRRQATPSTQPTVYVDNYSEISMDAMYTNTGSFASRDYIRRIPDRALRSRNFNLHTKWPSDLSDVTSEGDGFIRQLPPQRACVTSSGLQYRPLAGGAPFFTCCNCFELLLCPMKILTNQKKLRCSSCLAVIVCVISGKGVVFSIDVDAKGTQLKLDDTRDLCSTYGNGGPNHGRTLFSSIDYDNSAYGFQSMDQESQNNSIEVRNGRSEEEEWSDLSQAPQGSQCHLVNDIGEGNRSGQTENEKEFPSKITSQKIYRKDSSATEIDLSSNEYGNTGSTFDSGGERSRGEQLKERKGVDSFFAGFIKKSHKGLNKHDHDVAEEKANVTVNGHLIHDKLIKKAEKLAGPIHSGNYWYDFRAGFWGAIGGPCLGIIPPFIEEFNYPMHEKCGGGNTHVFVNGRELNQKDLNLLSSRGLPSESNRSYIIEISGRVLDEDTSEEFECLGKLAPRVEKAKCGFGMRDPSVVAQ